VEAMLRHRRLVTLVWLVLFVAGGATASRLPDRLTFDFSLPGQPGYTAEERLVSEYGVSTADTLVPVVTVPAGTTVADQREPVDAVFEAVRKALPQLRVVDLGSTSDEGFVSADGRTAFGLVQGPMPQGFGPGVEVQLLPVLEQAAQRSGLEVQLTSYTLLAAGGDSEGPSVLAETLIGATGALAVLVFVFASFLALLPLLIAAVSILTTFLIVLGLTTFTDVSFVVQFLISLVGLGVAIDYSLLVVSRWREELAHGRDNHDAVVTAVRTAGHAVLASGVTVAISLIALLALPVPFLRSMGFGGMLIPLVSVAVVLTLLPALLSSIGPRIDYPKIRREGTPARGWSAWARLIMRHRLPATAVALGALALLIVPVADLRIGQSDTESLATAGAPYDALSTLREGGIGTGVLTPIVLLVEPGDADAAVAAAREVGGVRTAVVDDVRGAVEAAVGGGVDVTGAGATVEDYFAAVYDNFPYVLALIAVITFVLLARTFRSLLLPLKAVVLNLISLAAVFGAIVFFWQQGNGSDALFGVSATGAITFWLPVIIFAFLFGLSMDYEVFILARMREEYDATGSTTQAVVTGLGRTGRLVTSAALILFFAFAALASAPGTDIKVLGTALGVGILIDATIVRALLVPALVGLFGRWNWWLPTGVARLLRVEPSPVSASPPPTRHRGTEPA